MQLSAVDEFLAKGNGERRQDAVENTCVSSLSNIPKTPVHQSNTERCCCYCSAAVAVCGKNQKTGCGCGLRLRLNEDCIPSPFPPFTTVLHQLRIEVLSRVVVEHCCGCCCVGG
jgi:hypothetical protein